MDIIALQACYLEWQAEQATWAAADQTNFPDDFTEDYWEGFMYRQGPFMEPAPTNQPAPVAPAVLPPAATVALAVRDITPAVSFKVDMKEV